MLLHPNEDHRSLGNLETCYLRPACACTFRRDQDGHRLPTVVLDHLELHGKAKLRTMSCSRCSNLHASQNTLHHLRYWRIHNSICYQDDDFQCHSWDCYQSVHGKFTCFR